MNHRTFLKSAAVTVSATAITPIWPKPSSSSAYQLVAATDRNRILIQSNRKRSDLGPCRRRKSMMG